MMIMMMMLVGDVDGDDGVNVGDDGGDDGDCDLTTNCSHRKNMSIAKNNSNRSTGYQLCTLQNVDDGQENLE